MIGRAHQLVMDVIIYLLIKKIINLNNYKIIKGYN